jgi:dephospho-CoA kinase
MFKIGLTGGICTGKTLILDIFKELNCYTIKADDIAKQIIFADDSQITEKIVERFGKEILDPKTGSINKETFAQILFEDSDKRDYINNFIHPMVVAERTKIINDLRVTKTFEFFIYESALLVESGTYKDFDKIIVAYTTPEEQIKRLMARDNIDIQEAEKRLKSQFPLNEKLKVANYTIDTSGSIENTKSNTLETYHLMKKDLQGG